MVKESLRIAIYHNLPSGGSKRALHEMTRRLYQAHEIDIYTLSSANLEFCDLRPYCRHHYIYPFQPSRMLASPFGRLNQSIRTADLNRLRQVQKKVAQDIDSRGYDLVFTHHCTFGQSPAVLSFLKTPSVYYCAEPPRSLYEPAIQRSYTNGGWKDSLDRIDPLIRIYRNALKRLDAHNARSARVIITNSAYSRESIYRIYGIFAQVCYLGVDRKTFRSLPVTKDNYVITTGAIRPDKGFDFVINSLALIPASERPRLVIIGNQVIKNELDYLGQLSRDKQVETEFRVLVSDDDLVTAYNQALLTVYAPILEPFGLVPLESMACGTPLVAVREAGVRETVIHNQTGILTERVEQAFAEAVMKLISNPSLRKQFSENSIQYVEECWSWDSTMEVLEGIFHTV